MGKRQRRIRARSAPGQVAGAANEKLGLAAHRRITACPTCVLPEGPCARSADRRRRPGRGLRGAVSCPEKQSFARDPAGLLRGVEGAGASSSERRLVRLRRTKSALERHTSGARKMSSRRRTATGVAHSRPYRSSSHTWQSARRDRSGCPCDRAFAGRDGVGALSDRRLH